MSEKFFFLNLLKIVIEDFANDQMEIHYLIIHRHFLDFLGIKLLFRLFGFGVLN